MGDNAKVLYDHIVCRKCYSSFAGRRRLAFVIDWFIWYCILILAGKLLTQAMTPWLVAQGDIELAAQILGWILLPVFFFKDGFSGRSPGKLVCDVQVIDEITGQAAGFGASFKRNLPLLIPFMPLFVGIELRRGYRIGDGWSHTKVIWKKFAEFSVFAAANATREVSLPKQTYISS